MKAHLVVLFLLCSVYSQEVFDSIDYYLHILNSFENATNFNKLQMIDDMMAKIDEFQHGLEPYSNLSMDQNGEKTDKLMKLIGIISKKLEESHINYPNPSPDRWFATADYQSNVVKPLARVFSNQSKSREDILCLDSHELSKPLNAIQSLQSTNNSLNFVIMKDIYDFLEDYIFSLSGDSSFMPYWQLHENIRTCTNIESREICKEIRSKRILAYLKIEACPQRFREFRLKYKTGNFSQFKSVPQLLDALITYLDRSSDCNQPSNVSSNIWYPYDSMTLIKAKYMLSSYDPSHPIEDAFTLANHLYSSLIASSLCNLENRTSNSQLNWIDLWTNQLLNNTWHMDETNILTTTLINASQNAWYRRFRNVTKNEIWLERLEGIKDSFPEIIWNVATKALQKRGNPFFRRYLVYVGESEEKKRNGVFAKYPGSHLALPIVGSDFFVLRSNITAPRRDRDQLNAYVKRVTPIIQRAMRSDFYNQDVSNAVKGLAEYGVNLLDFEAYDFLIVLKSSRFASGCGHKIFFDKSEFAEIRYHYNASWSFRKCRDWIFLFA